MFLSAITASVAGVLAVFLVAKWVEYQAWRNRPRGLFYFNDGKHTRSLDPAQVLWKLEKHPAYSQSQHLKAAWDGNSEATEICTQAVRDAFGVVPFASKRKPGLSTREMLDLLCCFYEWMEAVKQYADLMKDQPKEEPLNG